jgi:hypothetical protein
MAEGATSDVFGMGAYQLNVQFGGVTQPPPPPPSITADRYELNDTPATATNFGRTNSISQTNLTLHTTTDVDYYTFSPTKSGNYTVTVSPTQGTGTLSLTVLNAQQTVIASGQSSTGGVALTVNLTSGQQYFLKVVSPNGSLFVYSLNMATAPGGKGGKGGGGAEIGDGTPLGNTSSSDDSGSQDRESTLPAGIGRLLDALENDLADKTGLSFTPFTLPNDNAARGDHAELFPEWAVGLTSSGMGKAIGQNSALLREEAEAMASLEAFWNWIGTRWTADFGSWQL